MIITTTAMLVPVNSSTMSIQVLMRSTIGIVRMKIFIFTQWETNQRPKGFAQARQFIYRYMYSDVFGHVVQTRR